jgi:hypothetical protein
MVPSGDGGSDTHDNCIALCFDCHADQSSYDHKHPKGLKYSAEELKRHRDNWFDKYRNRPEISYSSSHAALDREIYKEISPIFRYELAILIDEQPISTPVEIKRLEDITIGIHRLSMDPRYEFVDPDIEGIWSEIKSLGSRTHALSKSYLYDMDISDKDHLLKHISQDKNRIKGKMLEFIRMIKMRLQIQ